MFKTHTQGIITISKSLTVEYCYSGSGLTVFHFDKRNTPTYSGKDVSGHFDRTHTAEC